MISAASSSRSSRHLPIRPALRWAIEASLRSRLLQDLLSLGREYHAPPASNARTAKSQDKNGLAWQ